MLLSDFFKILSYEEVVSFGKAQRNRQINKSHVNDFYTIIKDNKYVPGDDGTYLVYGIIPVIVNPVTNHILDGQHRVAGFVKACENGDLDDNARILVGFWSIEDEEQENLVTIMLNSKSKNWSPADYMDAYSQYLECYDKLKSFCETHTLCSQVKKNGRIQLKYRYAASMITGKKEQTALKSGAFTFTDEQFVEADKIHNELYAIRKKLNLPMSGTDIEDMACEWHVQRKFITTAEIKSIAYLPTSIKNRTIRNRTDWRSTFAELKDCIQKMKLKKAA